MSFKSTFVSFLYHEVTDNSKDSGFQWKSALVYKHPRKEFTDNLDVIEQSPYPVLLVNDSELSKEQKGIFLTFDDGGKSNMYIADELEKRNMHGHFFITTRLTDDPLFLSRTDIKELNERGHIIGSHSHNHPNVFKSLPFERMLEEWSTSKKILEDIIGDEVATASVPCGDSNLKTVQSANTAGIKYLFNSEPVIKPQLIEGTVVLGRVCPKQGTHLAKVEALANFKGIFQEQAKRTLKKSLKTIFYPAYLLYQNSKKINASE